MPHAEKPKASRVRAEKPKASSEGSVRGALFDFLIISCVKKMEVGPHELFYDLGRFLG